MFRNRKNTCQEWQNPQFEISYSVVAPEWRHNYGGIDANHLLYKCLKSAGLNSASVITIGGIVVCLWHNLHELNNFYGIM